MIALNKLINVEDEVDRQGQRVESVEKWPTRACVLCVVCCVLQADQVLLPAKHHGEARRGAAGALFHSATLLLLVSPSLSIVFV